MHKNCQSWPESLARCDTIPKISNKHGLYTAKNNNRHKMVSKVVSLDLKSLPILEIAIHNFEDGIRKTHAQ